jgi:hypothetical protein
MYFDTKHESGHSSGGVSHRQQDFFTATLAILSLIPELSKGA